jgi:hypothetical protein
MIPRVAASGRGVAQTRGVETRGGGCRTAGLHAEGGEKRLESRPVDGERPVSETRRGTAAS